MFVACGGYNKRRLGKGGGLPPLLPDLLFISSFAKNVTIDSLRDYGTLELSQKKEKL
jgi:hypothetical protein